MADVSGGSKSDLIPNPPHAASSCNIGRCSELTRQKRTAYPLFNGFHQMPFAIISSNIPSPPFPPLDTAGTVILRRLLSAVVPSMIPKADAPLLPNLLPFSPGFSPSTPRFCSCPRPYPCSHPYPYPCPCVPRHQHYSYPHYSSICTVPTTQPCFPSSLSPHLV